MIDWSKLEKTKTEQDIENVTELEQARAYLRETDWHAFSLIEDGTPIPVEIKEARTAARESIKRLAPST